MTRIAYDDLVTFTGAVLAKAGLDDFSRDAVTSGLCETSLRGVDSHGIRLLPHYAASALSGRKNPKPDFKFNQRFPAMGALDADDAFGHAAGIYAMDRAMEMAETQGTGTVSVFNSSHPGAMASFALKAARAGYIGFAFTHADALVVAHGGTRALFGTNPVCMAAPRREEEPFCLDMATSTIPWNRLMRHRASGTPLAEGLAADENGAPTTDANAARALSPTGGYKGYGLGAMVEILCGVMSGMAVARDIPAMFTTPMDRPRKLGQFYMAMRTDCCGSADDFRARLQAMTDAARSEPPREGEEVMLPGDPEIRESARRRRDGIPLDSETEDGLRALSETHDVPLVLT